MPIDKNIYPKDWEKVIRPRILQRAGHCCEHCGVPKYAIGYRVGDWMCVYAVGETYSKACERRDELMVEWSRKLIVVRLTIAHLDHNEWEDVPDERLAALCERCHFGWDREDNQKREKYGKHYARYQLTLI